MKKKAFWKILFCVVLMVYVFSLNGVILQTNAISVIKFQPFMELEKTWNDNNNAKGIRPEEVYYDLYQYSGEWEGTGANNARLILEGIPLNYQEWSDEWLITLLSDKGMDVQDNISFDGEITSKFKFVEQVPEGYVEVTNEEPVVLVQNFHAGEAKKLEKVGDHLYRIPNYDSIMKMMEQSTEWGTFDESVVLYELTPIMVFQSGSYVAAINPFMYNSGNMMNVYFGNHSLSVQEFLEKTYGDGYKYDGYPTNVLKDLEEDLVHEFNNLGLAIRKGGLIEVLPKCVENGQEIDNPIYHNGTNEVRAMYHMVTPSVTRSYVPAKSVNKYKEPYHITVQKVWSDFEDEDQIRPESVTVALLRNGKSIETQELSEENDWTYKWEDLPDYVEGIAAEYTVQEVNVPEGYEVDIKEVSKSVETDEYGLNETFITYELSNKHMPQVEVQVQKEWEDNNDETKKRPESITVELLADGKTVNTVQLSDANQWFYEFAELDKYNTSGKEIKYTVSETTVEGYVAEVKGSAEDGYRIVNTIKPGPTPTPTPTPSVTPKPTSPVSEKPVVPNTYTK